MELNPLEGLMSVAANHQLDLGPAAGGPGSAHGHRHSTRSSRDRKWVHSWCGSRSRSRSRSACVSRSGSGSGSRSRCVCGARSESGSASGSGTRPASGSGTKSGSGSGTRSGSGSGSRSGSGSGFVPGSRSGSGSGFGPVARSGSGSGFGPVARSGSGSGLGTGSGSRSGFGSGSGSKSGSRYWFGCGSRSESRSRSGSGSGSGAGSETWSVCGSWSGSETRSGSSDQSALQGSPLKGQNSPENAARERSRVRNLRQGFHSLQAALPSVPPDTKLSKLDVLVLATDYIAHLTETLDEGATGGAEHAPPSRPGGYLHPVKKWPMRSLLYCGSVGEMLSGVQASQAAPAWDEERPPTPTGDVERE